MGCLAVRQTLYRAYTIAKNATMGVPGGALDASQASSIDDSHLLEIEKASHDGPEFIVSLPVSTCIKGHLTQAMLHGVPFTGVQVLRKKEKTHVL